MRTLIISDTHLTHRFDEKKYLFLEKLISSYDAVILNGDFWDGYTTTFDKFISSKWSGLFPLLKAKRAIYLFGNHDQKQFIDERVNLYSIEQKDYHILEIASDKYHIEHGHLLEPGIDGILPIPRSLLKHLNFWAHLVENTLVRLGSPHNRFMKLANNTIKRKLSKKQFVNWYVCGHTHFAEFDENNKFANSGFIQYGKATYVVVDSQECTLKKEWYK